MIAPAARMMLLATAIVQKTTFSDDCLQKLFTFAPEWAFTFTLESLFNLASEWAFTLDRNPHKDQEYFSQSEDRM